MSDPTKNGYVNTMQTDFCGYFKAVKVQVQVLWVMTSCSYVVGCHRFDEPYCLRLQGVVLRYDAIVSEILAASILWV